MQPATSVLAKYECSVAAIASLASAVQWYAASWRSAVFIFAWVFVLINIPLLWYAARKPVLSWWRGRKA
jgi:hypothetical protein